MDVLIIYERKNREYENAVLLKLAFNRQGINCEIRHSYDPKRNFLSAAVGADIIFVPSLYNTKAVSQIICRHGKPKHIINLQYEQVLSDKWEKLGHHNPSGEAKNAFHVCWGINTYNRLIKAGVSEFNLKLFGAIQLDLLRSNFLEPKDTARIYLSDKYSLDISKKWNLFLSSFTYADISPERLKINESVANTNLDYFPEIYGSSRNALLEWFEEALKKDQVSIFIYRPHPDELNLEKVRLLAEKYKNFKIIGDESAKIWINAADKNYSWYSTTVVESHFMNKAYSILRPIPLPDDFDSVLLKLGQFIVTKENFINSYLNSEQLERALSDSDINLYYKIDETPSFSHIVNFVDQLLQSTTATKFAVPFKFKVRYYIFDLVLILLQKMNRNKNEIVHRGEGNIISQITKEIVNQKISNNDYSVLKRKILNLFK